jgi:DNA adenine methylase
VTRRPGLKSPFIWFGGKGAAVDTIWSALGNPPNYVEPFGATIVVLLNRPGGAGKIETVNDLDADISNFWRALKAEPGAVAEWADWPVNEACLHARSEQLMEELPDHRARMHSDPDYYDAKRAGWWVWGVSTAIGGNWMQAKGANASPRMCGWVRGNGMHAIPALGHSGRGIHSPERAALTDWFHSLASRLRRVRVACGDWQRVLSGAVTGASNSLKNMGMSPCGVYLDPPYDDHEYVYGGQATSVSAAVRAWAIEHGDDPHFRIAVSGYEGEHDFPESWSTHAWKAQGGHANRSDENVNRARERIWFSKHCIPIGQQRSLFDLETA